MRLIALLVLASAFGGALSVPSYTPTPSPPLPAEGYVAHEWGTFTAVAGQDGSALEWDPLDGPSDLPDFVYTPGGDGLRHEAFQKGGGRVRMETPVLYFHAREPQLVEVSVSFPGGQITEWYPRAREVEEGIDWGLVRVEPTADPELPHDGSDSHYYPARMADAAALKVCDPAGDEWERYLFYRGVGQRPLSLQATLEGEQVHVRGPHPGWVMLYERQGDAVGYAFSERLGALPRPALTSSAARAQADLRTLLIADGLYADEADAMIATWEDDWFEEGLRLIWILPDGEVERMLPLSLEPPPAQLVRTLVGRLELITPEREARVLELLDAPTEQALAALKAQEGRFAEPTLRRLLEDAEGIERARIEAALAAGWGR